MKQRIVFLGNAQARALHHAWCTQIAGSDAYDNFAVHYWFISDADREVIESADIIVLQISDREGFDVDALNLNARIIRYPYVCGAFLWPYCGDPHPNWSATLMPQCGVFNGECGDGYLARLHRLGISPSEAVERYAGLDIIKVARIERRYEIELGMQRLRDEKARLDLSMADYIDRNLSREILFISRQRLAKSIFWHLAGEIFNRLLRMLGDSEAKVIDGERLGYVPLWGRTEVPVHQQIVRHFGLPGRPVDYKYRVNLSRLTFDQYTADYMTGTFQEDIYAGVQLLEHGDHEAAVPILERGLAAAPGSPDGAAALSRAYAHLGRDSEALELACIAVHRDTENRDFLIDLAHRYRQCDHHEAARAALERCLEIDPCYPEAYRMLCDIFVDRGRSDLAINLARELSNKIPTHSFAHSRLGQLLLGAGDLDGAARSFHAAVVLNERDHSAWRQLDDVLRRLGRSEEAIELARSYVEKRGQDARSHAQLGQSLWQGGRLEEAEPAFRTAIRLAPRVSEYNAMLADLLSVQGHLDESLVLARALIEDDDDNAHGHSLLGVILWRGSDLEAATEAFRKAIVRDPANEWYRLQCAMVLAHRGRLDEAIEVMTTEVMQGSRNPNIHAYLGELYLQTADLEFSEAAFTRSLTLDATNERARRGLHEIRDRKG